MKRIRSIMPGIMIAWITGVGQAWRADPRPAPGIMILPSGGPARKRTKPVDWPMPAGPMDWKSFVLRWLPSSPVWNQLACSDIHVNAR